MKQSEKPEILIPSATKHLAKMKLRVLVKQALKNEKLYKRISKMTKKQRYKLYRDFEQRIIKSLKELKEKKGNKDDNRS